MSSKVLFIIEKIIVCVCVCVCVCCVLICLHAALIVLNAGLFKAAPKYFFSPQTLLCYFTERSNICAVF
jgi:hypothetical protein